MTGSPCDIVQVRGRRVWDSRGRPTVEVEIHIESGATGRAIAPAGASTGSGEATDLRDGGTAFGGLDVTRAVRNVEQSIAPMLIGRDVRDQVALDALLVSLDPSPQRQGLGGNALIAVSMACANAAANADGRPLWRRLLPADAEAILPLPEIQILGGGAHAEGRVDVQDFMVMPVGAGSFAQGLDWTAEIYRAAGARLSRDGLRQGVADEGGFWPAFETNEAALELLVAAIEDAGRVPGEEVAISLDIAASQFGKSGRYRLGLEGRDVDTDGLCAMLVDWIDRYPIASIEDPLAEDDHAGMRRFTDAVRDRVQVVGDDYLVTDAHRTRKAASDGACTALLVKPNQIGTLSEAHTALSTAHEVGFGTIVSARSGESEDVTIAHLAVGWSAGQLKVGSFARSERMAKWNEVLRIEEALGERGTYAGRRPLPGA